MVEPKEIDIDYRNIPASEMYSLFKKDSGKNSWASSSLDEVNKNIIDTVPKNNIKLIKGRVEITLLEKKNLPERISILRLDTDFYESSLIELERMYDLVSANGFIVYDDYGHWNGQYEATNEFFEKRNLNPILIRTSRKERIEIKKLERLSQSGE